MNEDPVPLAFEHVADFRVGDRLVLADPRYLASALVNVVRDKIPLSHTVEVRAGEWHAFTASTESGRVDFLLLCHASELVDDSLPAFDQAESPGFLAIDSDRLLAVDADLRDAPEIRAAVDEVPPAQLPVVVSEAGVACPVPAPGIYPVFVSRTPTRTVVFVAFERD